MAANRHVKTSIWVPLWLRLSVIDRVRERETRLPQIRQADQARFKSLGRCRRAGSGRRTSRVGSLPPLA